MRTSITLAAVLLLAVAPAVADSTVTLLLQSSKDGLTVSPGTSVDWTVKLTVSTGDNLGLALVACDLAQNDANPAFFDLPPGDPGSIVAPMDKFSRPLGVANPGEGSATTGYIGVQRDAGGHLDLAQIGGGANTFGMALPPGTGIGESADVTTGIGQSGEQTVLSGSFVAPPMAGAYTFQLENALANVLTEQDPSGFWRVAAATVNTAGASFTFTVGAYSPGDMDCSGAVNNADIPAFILALTNPTGPGGYSETYPGCNLLNGDVNEDGSFNNADIPAFVDLLTGG